MLKRSWVNSWVSSWVKKSRWVIPVAAGLTFAAGAMPETTVVGDKGPSTQTTPYVVPTAAGVRTVAILTVGDSVSPKLDGSTPYRMIGIPDGLGAFDNGDGTFTLLSNHELGSAVGVARAHGSIGGTVSAWRIDKSTLAVISGCDLVRTTMGWDYALQKWAPAVTTFNRFCSADLAAPTAFYNAATGKGTRDRLFLNGEENSGGRAFAHVASGPNAGVTYELPRLGREAWENYSACPFAQDKTIAIGQDDTTPGQVYVYIGTKTTTGNEVQRAGLANGKLWGVLANNTALEDRTTNVGIGAKGGSVGFTLLDLGDQSVSSTATETPSALAGVTKFLRPEDGAWDPSHPADYYFVTTDRFDQVKNATGAQIGRSRLWRLRFTDIANPENGGTIAMLLDGSEPHNMFDNLCVTKTGFILLQEDVGGNGWLGRIWRYEIATGAFTEVARHDVARFGNETTAPVAPFTNDEEASGIVDASDILGTGWFLLDDQAHYAAGDTELVEGGQFLALFDPACATAPAFNASVSASPADAVTGQVISFTAQASTPGAGALTYAWNFGDGSNGAGAAVTHAYTVSGTQHVTCTVTHTTTGRTAQGSVDVHVSKPAIATAVAIALNFAKTDKDVLTLTGEFPISAGFSAAGKTISIDVGGVARTFTLDAKGAGSASNGTCRLAVKSVRGAVPAQRAKFTMSLKNAALQAALAPLGLANADDAGKFVSIPVTVVFDGTTYESVAELVYAAKAGKSGSAK